ncbi:MAG: phenylacetic acid degradation b [Cyclobacteriaceae bacterium]|jgi:ring-1,2-phenylacetyl-CoA epoxidase subunit PaaB|nr:phenylacetic acid degradation b [Cyclobacteriaceae bacterium]
MVHSLDPRVGRLPTIGTPGMVVPKVPLDQLGTFEVFVQPKEGKPFQHEGIVHAPDLELAYVLAKETFTRRFTCTSLYVVETRHVYVSPTTEGGVSVAAVLPAITGPDGEPLSFELFMLPKRGKQHVHIGTVMATLPQEAMHRGFQQNLHGGKTVYNLWAVRTTDIRFTTPEEKELWLTLPEKKFRDAAEYKGGDKLKAFLEKQRP